MPQVFWATCPQCRTVFTVEKPLWDRDDPLMCPQCRTYFKRKDSPDIKAVWPPSFNDLRGMSTRD